jgi:hypothetical protein
MEKFDGARLEESFQRFQANGYEESMWITSVVKDLEVEVSALKQAFVKTDKPLGWYMAGLLSGWGREQFDFFKRSAAGGCSWGQVAYGWYFNAGGGFVQGDEKTLLEWLEKAAQQNNPWAMCMLGYLFRERKDPDKAFSYCLAGAELGWSNSMDWMAITLRTGEGCTRDLRQAVIWSVKGSDSKVFWEVLGEAERALGIGARADLGCDFNQLCYFLGWGLYWYLYGREDWNKQRTPYKAFASHCLDYYCSCVELQQESIFTFLMFWKRSTGGGKDVRQLIGKMVWEERETRLVRNFEQKQEGWECVMF